MKITRLSPLLFVALWACPRKDAPPPLEAANEVRVQSFTPEGRTGTQPIEVRFSKPIVDAKQVGQPASGRFLTITPELPGKYEWRQPDLLAYVPNEPLRSSTRYRVVVNPEISTKLQLGGQIEYEFHTELFALRSIEPFFEGVDPNIRVRVNLEFSHAVRPGQVRDAVRFDDSFGNPIDADLESRRRGKVMSFRLNRALRTEEATEIKAHIDESLGPSVGGEPLGKSITRNFSYAKPKALQVQRIQPETEDGRPAIGIRFSVDVDPATLEKAVVIEPNVKHRTTERYRGGTLVGDFKPGATYKITVRQGLVARQGGVLEEEVTRTIVVPDLEPQVRFGSEGSYLMRSGKQNFGIETVNVKKVRVTVDKVFENNIVHVLPRLGTSGSSGCWDDGCYDYYDVYYDGYYGDLATMGSSLFSGTVAVDEKKNNWILTSIPFDEIDADDRRGLYRVRVADEERGWIYAEKWMLATDLGLTVKVGRTEARAQVLSLSTLRPMAGVEVQFISQTNQLIGTARTDAQGVATRSLRDVAADEPLSLITARRGKDFSYLALSGTQIPTADFDVGGAGDTASPYEAYVYADRGVYRPGDKAHVTVLMRDQNLTTPPAFPFKVEIRTPRWRVFRTMRGSTAVDGAQAFTVELPSDAMTGDYTLRVITADGRTTLGRLTLKVEDFMPDRIKVDVSPEKPIGELSERMRFSIESAFLFGAKAAGLAYDYQCRFQEVSVRAKAYRAFNFGADDSHESRRAISHREDGSTQTLSEEGKGLADCQLHNSDLPRRPIRVSAFATVSERGGRAVTAGGSALLHAHPYYVGIRRNSSQSYAEINKDAGLEVMAVDREGKPKPGAEVTATIYAVEWKSILKHVNNRYRYVSERSQRQVGTAKVTTAGKPVKLSFKPDATGQYRIDVTSGPTGTKSTITFWASGPGYGAWEMSKPDQVALTLDKASYAPGEVAKLMVRAPFSGRLQVSVERDRVLVSRAVDLKGNSGTVYLPISAAMTPNAYVVAQLIRSPNSVEKQAPMRAFGVIPIKVRAEQHKLSVSVDAPKELRPNNPLEVKVKVDNARGFARMTVAAVDEGILRITGHATPDPFKFFTRKKRLGLRTHDMFDMLLPEVTKKATSIVRAAGGDAEVRKKHLSPVSVKRVKPVALWSGIVKLAPDGTGVVTLDVPQFQGALRVMAVAFERERFGSGSQLVRVRDPIVLTPTLPRFVGPLDKFQVPVEVFNGTGSQAPIEVTMRIDGRLKVAGASTQKLTLNKGTQGLVMFEVQADEVAGKAKITLTARGGGVETRSITDLGIRPPNTVTTEGATLVASYNKGTTFKIPGGFLPGTMKTQITIGAAPAAQFGASLQYLLRYPHGCVEQTTSRAFPLLYIKDLARHSAPELAKDQSVDYYVNGGISRVTSMLNRHGGLSYWPGGSYGYSWSTVYGAHFLVEAKKAGYEVDKKVLDALLGHLHSVASGVSLAFYKNKSSDMRTQAYALYVLALAGRPNRSALIYAADKIGRSKNQKYDEETRALVSGALALSGERGRAAGFLSADVSLAEAGPQKGFWSRTRADALTLAVLADVAPRHKSVPVLMKNLISRASIGRWGNTQENAYALMALGKIGRTLGSEKYWGSIVVGGVELKKFNSDRPISFAHEGSDWTGKDVAITITGKGTAFIGIQVEGIKGGLLQPEQKGIEVTRTFHDRDGNEVSPQSVKQGDLLVAKIHVKPISGARVENVAVVDLLAAGLEIENPRLSGEGVLPWMKDRSVPDYTDIRDDRIIMFTHIDRGGRTFYYTARAVTRGQFVLPHVHAEAMYDPVTHGWSGGGRLTVE